MRNQIIGSKSKTSIISFFKIIPKKPPAAAPQIDNTIKPKVMKSSSTQLFPSTPDIQDILETAHRNKSPLKLSLFQRPFVVSASSVIFLTGVLPTTEF